MAPEETKLTLKVGVIASFVAAFVVFILSCLWGHQIDITTLKAEQVHNKEALIKLEMIPTELARINEQLRSLATTQIVHRNVSETNLKMLKRNGEK